MIQVCDAIMGAGKTTAAITYMNEHPEKKFIYITPFNKETERIQAGCPGLNIRLPDKKEAKFDHEKRQHLKYLLSCNQNVAVTHQLFSMADDETIHLIHDRGYTAFIDEAITVINNIQASADDVNLALQSQYFSCEDGEDGELRTVTVADDSYSGEWAKEIKLYAKSHRLVSLKNQNGNERLYCWMFNADIMLAAADTIILTYLFKASPMYYMLQLENIPYQTIGVVHENGVYRFSNTDMWVPDYTKSLPQKIHIEQNKKMNAIGQRYHALSVTWFDEAKKTKANGRMDRMKKNLYNFFRYNFKNVSCEQKLWSCPGKVMNEMKGKGFANRFLAFNSRATNDYKDSTVLAYCVNVFMPVWEMKYFEQRGIEVDDRAYALSTMIQWIWRSAIRDGKDIWIYVPSRRMRELLTQWIADVSNGIVSGDEIGVVVEPKKIITEAKALEKGA